MVNWYRGAGLLPRTLFVGVIAMLVALVAYSFLARSRRMAFASDQVAPLQATPTPLIDPASPGVPAIDAAQPEEVQTATLALG